jgi:hypothetical protein
MSIALPARGQRRFIRPIWAARIGPFRSGPRRPMPAALGTPSYATLSRFPSTPAPLFAGPVTRSRSWKAALMPSRWALVAHGARPLQRAPTPPGGVERSVDVALSPRPRRSPGGVAPSWAACIPGWALWNFRLRAHGAAPKWPPAGGLRPGGARARGSVRTPLEHLVRPLASPQPVSPAVGFASRDAPGQPLFDTLSKQHTTR